MTGRRRIPATAGHLSQMLRSRLDPAERYGLRLALVGLAVVIVAVPFSALTFQVLGRGTLTRFDSRVANAMNDVTHRHDWAVTTLLAISWLGRAVLLAALVLAAVVFVRRRGEHQLAVFLLATTLGGGLVNTLVKIAVDRPRPVVDHPMTTAFGKSFPSGHAMTSTVTYGALLIVLLPLVSRRVRAWLSAAAVVLVLAIGCSRLLLGVHFVSDVVGGYLLGVAWLSGATAAFEAWRVDRGEGRSEPPARRAERHRGPEPIGRRRTGPVR